MKVFNFGIVVAMLISFNSFAGGFAGVSYDFKDNQDKESFHDVTAFTFGTNVNDRTQIAVRAEVENVRQSNDNLEGLLQVQGKFTPLSFDVGVPVSVFVTGSLGEKLKVGNNFPFYA